MFDPKKDIGVTMDAIEKHDGDLFIVLDPLKLPIANATTEYTHAKKIQIRDSLMGVIIHISQNTIDAIADGSVTELYL